MVLLSDPPAPITGGSAATEPAVRCGAIVARQLTLWPFGTRLARLFLLLDASPVDPELMAGLLRAMQQAYLRTETGSQTNAVRAAVLAVHYVLRHHNHSVLPHAQVTASAAVAATRGRLAYVAMVGEAAAFAWSGGVLAGQRSTPRGGRPLGLEHEPRLTLWSTPLKSGDRLVMVCGGAWHVGAADTMREILGSSPTATAEERIAEALAGPDGHARVLVDDGVRRQLAEPRRQALPQPAARAQAGPRKPWRRWLAPLVPLALFGAGLATTLYPGTTPQHLVQAQRAEQLLSEAEGASDVFQAHQLAASAREAATRAAALAPDHGDLITRAARALETIDRAQVIAPAQIVRLGPTGTNVVDLAVSDERVFTLDVVEGSVRSFDASLPEQQPSPSSLVLRKGAALGARSLDTPVAIQYVASSSAADGALTVIDRQRMIVQVLRNGSLSAPALPSSAAWQRLGALGASAEGDLFVLDSGARALLEYPAAGQGLADPPRPVLSNTSSLDADFQRVGEVLPLQDIYLRFEDGSVRRFDRGGAELPFSVRPPDGRNVVASAIAADRAGGLYVADTGAGRVLHLSREGEFVRQLRDPSLAGVRALQTSQDGRRLYGLVGSGVLAFDLPELAADSQP